LNAAAAGAVGVIALAAMGSSARGASVYWDGDGVGNVGGGSGQWNLTLNRFSPTPAGSSYSPFVNGDVAVFGGIGGVVNFNSPSLVQADLDLQANGYFFYTNTTGAQFSWTSSATVNVANGVTSELHLWGEGAASGLTKTGGGTFAFSGPLARTSGPVTVDGGTLRYARYGATIGSSKTVTINAPGTLNLGKFVDTVGPLFGDGTIVLGAINDATNVGTFSATGGPVPPNSIWGATLTVDTNVASCTFGGNIIDDGQWSGALAPFSGGHLVKLGSGTLTLTGTASTFHGSVFLRSGKIAANAGGAVPAYAPLVISPFTTFALGASQAVGSLGNYNADMNTDAGISALVDVGTANTLTIGADNLVNEYNGLLSGSGVIVKVGSGTQWINTNQTGSTFSGKYVVQGGTLGFPNVGRLGAEPAAVVPDYFTLDGGTIASAMTVSNNFAWGMASFKRGITVGPGGGGIRFNYLASLGSDFDSPIRGSGTLARSGPGFLNFQGDNSSFSGDWSITNGISNFGSGPAYNAAGLGSIPAGTGSWDVSAARVQLATNDAIPGNQQSYTLASEAGGTFSYGPGVVVGLGHTGASFVTVTVGDPAAGSSTLIRKPNGNMMLNVLSGPAALGTTGEHLIINGGVPTVSTNGGSGTLVPGVLVAQSDGAAEGFFATYDNAGGFKVAPVSTKTDINTADSSDVYQATGTNFLTAPGNVYALKVGNTAGSALVSLMGQTLHVGAGPASDPAVVILRSGSNITGGTVDFGDHEAVIAAFGGCNFNGAITSSQGLTKMGYGQVILSSAATLTYPGATRIEHGQLVMGKDNQLPATTDLIFCGAPSTTPAANPSLILAGKQVSVNSINTTGPGYAVIDIGNNGLVKITGSGSSVYDGTITNGAGTSTLWNSGGGTLKLGVSDAVFSDRSSAMVYNKLWNTGGGTITLPTSSDMSVFPANPAGLTGNTYLLNNASTFRFQGIPGTGIGSSTSNAPPRLTINNGNRGFGVGAGGGTIEVENPYQQIGLDGAGGVYASGPLTKTGAGILVMPASTKSGVFTRYRILGGVLQLTGDPLLGSPTALKPDAITLDNGGALDISSGGGAIDLSGFNGITIGAGGGVLRQASGSLRVLGPIVGSGPLRIAGVGNSPGIFHQFLGISDGTSGSSGAYTGTVTLATDTPVFVSNKNALGIGTITNDPAYPAQFGTTLSGVMLNSNFNVVAGRPWDWVISSGSSLTLAGVISGDGLMFKGLNNTSPNTLTLSNSLNSFTGQLVISQGNLAPVANGALGSTGTALVVNGGSLNFTNTVNYTSPKPVRISGSAITVSNGALVTYAGAVTLTSSATIALASGALTLTNDTVGASDSVLTKIGSPPLSMKNLRAGGLTVSVGQVKFLPSGGVLTSVSDARTLSLAANTKLDLTDNKLITASPAGTWNGGAYTGVQGLVQAGRNGSTLPLWDGNGMITSQTHATSGNYTSIGVAQASDVRPATATATDLWAGQTITGTDALIMYTYGGDANLDGKLDILDYVRIDQGLAGGLSGWANGDFNYDGKVNIEDYASFIDANLLIQGAAFPTAGGAAGGVESVVAVPEPGVALGAIAAGGLVLRRRGRKLP
jgi:autotransporter-associated beta strand protein